MVVIKSRFLWDLVRRLSCISMALVVLCIFIGFVCRFSLLWLVVRVLILLSSMIVGLDMVDLVIVCEKRFEIVFWVLFIMEFFKVCGLIFRRWKLELLNVLVVL